MPMNPYQYQQPAYITCNPWGANGYGGYGYGGCCGTGCGCN